MRRLVALSLLLATAFPAWAEDWTTADGNTYKNVVILYQEDDGVRVTYDGGVGKLPYYELPIDVQKRLGQDIQSLEAKKKAADAALAKRAADLAEQQRQQAITAAAHPGQPGSAPGTAPRPSPAAGGTQPGQAATAQNPGAGGAQPVLSSANQAAARSSAPAGSQAGMQSAGSSARPASAAAVHPEDQGLYPGARYTYSDVQDTCYLDSFAATAAPESAADAPAGTTNLIFRVASDGKDPYTPNKIEAIFASGSTTAKALANQLVVLIADGTRMPLKDKGPKESNFGTDTSGLTYVIFYLTPDQARSVVAAKELEFSTGNTYYKFDPAGLQLMRKYFAEIDRLPPPPTNFARSYSKFLTELPTIIAVISQTCEYIVLGSFTLLVVVSIAAFAMGLSRFIKM